MCWWAILGRTSDLFGVKCGSKVADGISELEQAGDRGFAEAPPTGIGHGGTGVRA